MPSRHCTGCFAALPAWPPPRCPRCRRPTYTLLVRRVLMASALAIIAGCGVWLWVKLSPVPASPPSQPQPADQTPRADQAEP